MRWTLHPIGARDAGALRALLAAPELAREFDAWLPPGMTEQFLADPHLVADGMRLARAGDAAAGFVLSYALDEPDGAVHAFLRFGVAAAERRRGLGTRLLELGLAAVRAARPDRPLSGLSFGAWQPFDGADAFAARHGLVHARRFWRMERPAAPAAAPVWPAGIAVRTFDGSDAALADWNDVYNASFAGHWRFVPGTLEEARAIAAAPLFDPAGLALAYRDGRCLGFCRTESAGEIGVIGVLGTHPAARGLGLGRALLRWGVAHLAGRGFARIGLLVDGRNDGALALYRSEGFAVTRTREIWERVPA